jgi:hypothetical protein
MSITSRVPDNYAVLAAAHGHLGNADSARAALDQLLRRMPGLTAADERLNRPFGSTLRASAFLKGCVWQGCRRGKRSEL